MCFRFVNHDHARTGSNQIVGLRLVNTDRFPVRGLLRCVRKIHYKISETHSCRMLPNFKSIGSIEIPLDATNPAAEILFANAADGINPVESTQSA